MSGDTSTLDVSVPTDRIKPIGVYCRSHQEAQAAYFKLSTEQHEPLRIVPFHRNDFMISIGLKPYFLVCWEHVPDCVAQWRIQNHIRHGKEPL